MLLCVRRDTCEANVSELIMFYRIPPPCPRLKEEEGEEVAAAVVEEEGGSVCFGPAGSTKGTSTALSTIASLFE